MSDSSPHSRVWFSPHGTEWEAETYEEALEMERDSLFEQLEAARKEADGEHHMGEEARRVGRELMERKESLENAIETYLREGKITNREKILRAALDASRGSAPYPAKRPT